MGYTLTFKTELFSIFIC